MAGRIGIVYAIRYACILNNVYRDIAEQEEPIIDRILTYQQQRKGKIYAFFCHHIIIGACFMTVSTRGND